MLEEKCNKIFRKTKVEVHIECKKGITKKYLVSDKHKLLHSDIGPAIISEAGREYYNMGKLHRPKNQGPAIEYNFRNVNNNDYDFNAGYYNSTIMRNKLSKTGMFEEYWENGHRVYLDKSEINPFY